MSLAAGLAGGAQGISAIGGFFGRRARAKAMRNDAEAQLKAGAAQSADVMREGRAAEAAGAAAAGASGFTVAGSAVDVLANMAAETSTSAARVRWQASRRSLKIRNEARQEKRAATFGLVSGVIGAGASVAGGFNNAED